MTRGDHLPLLDPNPGKVAAALEVLRAFRRAAPRVAANPWERVFRTGPVRESLSAAEEAASPRLRPPTAPPDCAPRLRPAKAIVGKAIVGKAIVGPARLQMLRRQGVGRLESFLANRAHEVREAVLRSSRPEDIRPPLLLINRLQAWFSPALVVLGRTRTSPGPAVPPETRRLARSIMRAGLQRHRRPTWGGLHPHIDQRQAELERLAPGEAGGGHAGLWLDLRGLRPRLNRRGQPTRQQALLRLPLRAYADHAARVGQGGTTALTVQRIERPAARAESVTHRLPDGTACPTGVRASSSWAW